MLHHSTLGGEWVVALKKKRVYYVYNPKHLKGTVDVLKRRLFTLLPDQIMSHFCHEPETTKKRKRQNIKFTTLVRKKRALTYSYFFPLLYVF